MTAILTIIGLLVVCAICGYLYLAITCAFTEITYMTGFNIEFESSGDLITAHKKAIATFHARPPFNKLSQKDLEMMATEFAKFPEPRLAARLMKHMDKTKDLGDFLGRGDRIEPKDMRN